MQENEDSTAKRRSAFLSDDEWRWLSVSLKLSRRQEEIVRCIVDGDTHDTIAGRLGISSHTVHTYLERLYRKLEVHNERDLVSRIFMAYSLRMTGRDQAERPAQARLVARKPG
ncbi:MAG: helix-turn-helix transcriptional regulator [Gemmatimonadetes bacterium]|nr:helix-turn-helix transcriptional regulator [Gemmatimonadota bacterium]